MQTAIVVNPTKVADLDQSRKAICAALAEAGLPDPAWFETTADDPGYGQTRRAIAGGADVVVAVGGDGTVRACAHELAGTGVALAVLPAGTGNLLAANLDLPSDVDAVVAAVAGGSRRSIDLGRVDGTHFAVMAGLGFDAAMMSATPEAWKKRVGWPAYVVDGARRILDRPMHVRISLDGAAPLDRVARTVLVANVGRLQGGVDLFGGADPEDGVLDVAVVMARGLGDWLSLAARIALRREPSHRQLETFRASTVDISCGTVQPRQLDGDAIEPSHRLSARVEPATLVACAP